MQKLQNIKRVAIIGAGPAGVATAKYLLAEGAFTTIDVFEQRSTCAGVWNYTPENDHEEQYAVPQTKPYVEQEKPIWRKGREHNPRVDDSKTNVTFTSPLYERLEANLPKMMMQHSDVAFPDEEQLFPTHEAITDYLERYADDIRHLIKFETQMVAVKTLGSSAERGWSVTTENLVSRKRRTAEYDAVAVATGHYNAPLIPDIPGIREWNKQYPGSVTHSKFFRRPEDFSGKKVLSLGIGASGQDIATQIEKLCISPLLVSSRAVPTPPSPSPSRLNLGEILEFIPSTRSVRFKFPPNHIEHDVDIILFCTGYLYSYPGFDQSQPPFESLPLLSTDNPGARTHNIYEHIFYTPVPTLAFLALPQKVIPFPLSESQGAVIAGVWSGRLELPGRAEMQQWEAERAKDRGDGKTFHYMKEGEDVQYINMLHDWAVNGYRDGEHDRRSTPLGTNGHHLNGSHEARICKEPPYWGAKEQWIRPRIAEMKAAFNALGEKRHEVKTLEELGFDYEKWRRRSNS